LESNFQFLVENIQRHWGWEETAVAGRDAGGRRFGF